MIDTIFDYLGNAGAITILVLFSLSLYLIFTFWIFFYKNILLAKFIRNEKDSLESLIDRNSFISPLSALRKCIKVDQVASKELLNAGETSIIREASTGISWLSIISSTSPFIGLFGTVIGILESFAKFSSAGHVGFSVIAPAISEALVSTAAGIFVAIFAYTFHQILNRKVYELHTYIKSQADILISRN